MFISYPTEIGIGIDHVTLTIGGMINVRLVSSLTRLDLTKNKICSEVIWMLWNSCIQTCKTGDQPYSDGFPPPQHWAFSVYVCPCDINKRRILFGKSIELHSKKSFDDKWGPWIKCNHASAFSISTWYYIFTNNLRPLPSYQKYLMWPRLNIVIWPIKNRPIWSHCRQNTFAEVSVHPMNWYFL